MNLLPTNVLFIVSYYKGEPDEAAAAYHIFVKYVLADMLSVALKLFWSWHAVQGKWLSFLMIGL